MLKVIQNLVSPDKYQIKCPYPMKAECIVVHNTYNDAPAKNEVAYMIRNNNATGFHYAIDDKEIVQGIPENRNAYANGDGNGKGNRTGISIEICYSKSGGIRFDKAEILAARFIAQKLKEYNWGIDRVKKHQDFANKYCPHRTLDRGWDRFLKMILSAINGTLVDVNDNIDVVDESPKNDKNIDDKSSSNVNTKKDSTIIQKDKILVDGKEYEVHKILKDNQNYIKLADLRDIGLFKVKYDNLKKQITINTK